MCISDQNPVAVIICIDIQCLYPITIPFMVVILVMFINNYTITIIHITIINGNVL